MTSSRNSSSACLSGIVRLLLCKGSLQTHPSDQITVPTAAQFDPVKKDLVRSDVKVQAPAGNPGVVARLMGLDSLPDTNWVPKGRAPDSVTRSRSVNFMDYLLQLDLTQAQHRRVRTSVSFREVPTLSNQQNHDFLVLYLDNDAERNGKMGCEMRNSDEVSIGEVKQRSNNEGKIKDKNNKREEGVMKEDKNQGTNTKISLSKLEDKQRRISDHKQSSRFGSCKGAQVSSGFVSFRKKHVYRKSGENSKAKSPVKPINQKEELVESKFMKKMSNRHQPINDLKSEYSSSEDSSSPVSVICLGQFSVHDHETPLSYEKGCIDLNSKKTISSPKTRNFDYLSSHPTAILNKQKAMKENDYGYGSFENGEKEYYMELVKKVCKLTEEDIKESNWMIAKNGIFEEIVMDFGQEILDILLHQVVEELAFSRIMHMGNLRSVSVLL